MCGTNVVKNPNVGATHAMRMESQCVFRGNVLKGD